MTGTEGTAINPLIPSALDVAFILVVFAVAIYAVMAFVSLVRSPAKGVRFLWWSLLVVLVPIIGPTVWFIAGRTRSLAGVASKPGTL